MPNITVLDQLLQDGIFRTKLSFSIRKRRLWVCSKILNPSRFFFFFLNEIIQILVRRLINSYFAFVMHPYNVFLMTSKAGWVYWRKDCCGAVFPFHIPHLGKSCIYLERYLFFFFSQTCTQDVIWNEWNTFMLYREKLYSQE